MTKMKIFGFIIAFIYVSALASSASYEELQFKDIEVIYAAKLLATDSSGAQKEAIFGVVGLWLPSQIREVPEYFNNYTSWRDTLLGESSILVRSEKLFGEIYSEEELRKKYNSAVEQCQNKEGPIKLEPDEICSHLATFEAFRQYLKDDYESGATTASETVQRRRAKILSTYNEEQLRNIYEEQKTLLDRGLWVRDIKLYFEIDGKKMLNTFARFNFYNDDRIKSIYAKFYELDDWKESVKKDVFPDAEVLIVFDKDGSINAESSKIIMPPIDSDSSALSCNLIEEKNDFGANSRLWCKSRCMQLDNETLMHTGQEDEYDFFKIFWERTKESGRCAGNDVDAFQSISAHRDCTSNTVLSVIASTAPITVNFFETNDVIHFGWNWAEGDKFVWGKWNMANLEGVSYDGCVSASGIGEEFREVFK